MNEHHAHLTESDLAEIRPTQMTVGLAEVTLKREQWRKRSEESRKRYLADHRFPAVRGPKKLLFIIDHHHLGLALLKEGVKAVQLSVLRDLSGLEKDEFWLIMDHRQWVHPYDARGKRQDFAAMPKRLDKLADDPYRSLAAEVRRCGEYAKDPTPFSEFLWADFFRRRIPVKLLSEDHAAALARAEELARHTDARHLPGWSTFPNH